MDIHRCRFVQYPANAINALAFSHPSSAETHSNKKSQTPATLRLALGRANGEIEIWNPCDGIWNQETIIRGGKDRSIEGLAWVQDPEDVDKNGHKVAGKLRLFSIGYSTSVTEWDLGLEKPVRHSGGNYGEIWCMAVQPRAVGKPKKQIANGDFTAEAETQLIAVGCADGAIVLHSTADGDLRFKKLVSRSSKKGSRVLSITFQNRDTVITGHADSTIRVYDIRTGRQVRNITLGGGPKGAPRETLIWSVRCCADGTLVSGDSTGMMCFWDGKTYSLAQRIKAHDADILDVAVSVDGQAAFSGGMDRKTCFYKRTSDGSAGGTLRWAKMSHSRMHDHDVKTMATYESRDLSVLVSGGLDTYPIVVPFSEYGREYFRRLVSLPEQPPMLSVPRRRLVIAWWDREINIWSISKRHGHEVEGQVGKNWKVVAKAMLSGEESIAAVSVTPTGSLLAVSTIVSTKTFRLSRRKDGTLKLHKMSIPPSLANNGGKLLDFSPDSKWLCAILPNDDIKLYEITEDSSSAQYSEKPTTLHRLPRTEPKPKPAQGTLGNYNRSINRVSFSAGSDILAVSDHSGYLDTWILTPRASPSTLQIDSATKDTNLSSSQGSSPESSADSDSDDSNSDSGNDSTNGTPPSHGHWRPNPSGALLPRLPSSIRVLSFRPSPFPPSSSSPHTSSPSEPTKTTEDRLLLLTTSNSLLEFHTLSGKLTDWSRRNPPSVFPAKWRGVLEHAKGVVWDVSADLGGGQGRERVWVYGISWVWMVDLGGDVPRDQPQPQEGEKSAEEVEAGVGKAGQKTEQLLLQNGNSNGAVDGHPHDASNGTTAATTTISTATAVTDPQPTLTSRKKRKLNKFAHRPPPPHTTTDLAHTTPSLPSSHLPLPPASGAGGRVERRHLVHSLGFSVREVDGGDANPDTDTGTGEQGQGQGQIQAQAETPSTATSRSSGVLSLLRPSEGGGGGEGEGERVRVGETRHSFKYRPILGIVPLSFPAGEGEVDGRGEVGADGEVDLTSSRNALEVVLVERPEWDLELPGRFVEVGAQS